MAPEATSQAPGSGPTRTIDKVLIANRGEIAVRILRTLKDMGIRSAVIYSDADRLGLPVLLADEAYPIGPAPSSESYLRGDAIIELALRIGADAIHPGYGFLSENAEFATRCAEAGVIFIGPPPSAIAAMGSKVESRRLMMDADVPVVPGGRDPLPDVESALAFAEQMGYPVMLKAASGGGGKGMRVVHEADQLPTAYRTARGEAKASFGDDEVYLEKFIIEPRHVEIQVLGDEYGHLVSLGERECSLQRRHQKVVEEAPSPVVGPELRRRMGDAAVQAAQAVGYTNAGTVEFLLDASGDFFFLEVNTRLQVEHPITELVTGLDLVEAQVRVARGEKLPPEAIDVEPRGHALEFRLYAEDPFRGFVPSPGLIEHLRWPEGPGVRVDAGLYSGSEVSIHYDPMIAKVIFYGTDRAQALRRARRGLLEMRVEGIRTTVPLFLALLEDDDFLSGRMDISMLDRKLANGELAPPDSAAAETDDSATSPDERPDSDTPESAARPVDERPATLDDARRDATLLAAAIAHVEALQRRSGTPNTGAQGTRSGWRQSSRLANLRGGRWG